MTKRTILCLGMVGLWILTLAGAAQTDTKDSALAVKARIVESCSCDPACPCMFGSPMTNETCEGSRLYEILEGSFRGVDVGGLKVVVTFSVGKWVKYYVADGATDKQVKVVEPLISRVSPVFDVKVLSVERAPISVERTAKRVRFSVPASTVEIEMMEGLAGGPIKIQDLPYHDLANYVQYKSVENSHHSADIQFHYSGTNGFTSTVHTKE
jgi:hypothetical protein